MTKYHLNHVFPSIDSMTRSDCTQLGDYVANCLLNEDKYVYCPNCGEKNIKNNGHVAGKQRGVCPTCGKSFNVGRPPLMYRSRLSKELWYDFIVEMFNLSYQNEWAIPKFDCINKNTATRMYKRCIEYIDEYKDEYGRPFSAIINNVRFSEANYARIEAEMKTHEALKND